MDTKSRIKIYLNGLVVGMLLCIMLGLILDRCGVIRILTYDKGVLTSEEQKAILAKSKGVLRCIDEYYYGDIDHKKMEDNIYRGIVNGLGDKYAEYFNKEEYQRMSESLAGTIYGIGAYVSQKKDTGEVYIVKPMTDGPAEKAGIKSGDVIYSVDDKVIKGMNLSAVLELVHGKKGTKVKIKVIHANETVPEELVIVRDLVEVDTVVSEMLEGSIGYIQITNFDSVTPKQFSKQLGELESKEMKALIVDLRDNGGGVLDGVISVIDRMLPKGVATYTLNKDNKKDVYYLRDDVQVQVPVAVLVNENTASASELFAGAMQDSGKAVLVGTNTFGKGIVQSFIDFEDGSAVKLTTSKYYTPKGRNIHEKGLKPDIEIKLDLATIGKKTPDNQMQKAIDYLKEKIS